MRVFPILSVLAVLLIIISAGCVSDEKPISKETAMTDVINSIDDRLKDCTAHITVSAKSIAGKNPPEYSGVLAGLFQNTTLAQSIIYVDENDILVSGYPGMFKDSIGKDMSSYGHSQKTFTDNDVVMSGYLPLEDGTKSCVIAVPVNADGKYRGYISMAFDTYRLFGSINDELNDKYGYNMWVVQKEGTQIYDPDLIEVGANIITDAEYSNEILHKALTEIVEKDTGTVQYSYKGEHNDSIVVKEAYWKTYEFGGQIWRVVITSVQ